MNICLIDTDLLDNSTNFPNLALMKISGYHKYKNNVIAQPTPFIVIVNK